MRADERRVFAVLGDPIAHSRSPAMQGAAFAALGLPHVYVALRVSPADLPAALAGARALGFGGLNLTVPHKRAAVGAMDALGPAARRIGAVNTVAIEGGRLCGENTDSPGFALALGELGAAPRRAIVLGAGGASAAVIDALLGEVGAEDVRWVSRTPAAIEGPEDGRLRRIGYEELAGAPLAAELLVNCTTVGMHGGATRFPVELDLGSLAGGAAVVDIVYPRPPGGLLDQADALGLRTQDGREMLLWQGVLALSRWLGRSIPGEVVAAMRAALG